MSRGLKAHVERVVSVLKSARQQLFADVDHSQLGVIATFVGHWSLGVERHCQGDDSTFTYQGGRGNNMFRSDEIERTHPVISPLAPSPQSFSLGFHPGDVNIAHQASVSILASDGSSVID